MLPPAVVPYPNVGAEEGAAAAHPAARAVAQAWTALFDDPPAWPWLVARPGLVPWLGTDDAVEEARRRGISYAGPDPAVVRVVHDKAFALRAARVAGVEPAPIRDVPFVVDADALRSDGAAAAIEARVAAWPARFRASFTLKPRFGTSGRGRVAGRDARLDDAARNALPRLAARGGCVVEPWLARKDDLSTCWRVDDDGGIELLGSTRQHVSGAGVHKGNVVDDRGRSGHPRDDEMVEAARAVVVAARDEGLRGPCGVDAFTFVDEGREHLRAVVELNARFTAGIVAVGLSRRRSRTDRCPPR